MSRPVPSKAVRILLTTACLMAATALQAAPTVYAGLDNASFPNPATNAVNARNQFVAAAGAGTITTQDYDSVSTGDLAPVTTGVLANGVGVTVTKSTVNGYLRVSSGVGLFDTYPTSGRQYLEGLSDANSTYFTAVFDTAVSGLGFFVSDVSDWVGDSRAIDDIEVVLTTAGGSTLVFDLTPGFAPSQLVDGNLAFFGVIDTANPFTSIAIRSGSQLPGGDALGFDDFMVSLNRVPEPGTLTLAGLALLGAAALRRQRR